MLPAHLRQGIARDFDVLAIGKSQRAAVRKAALQNKIPGKRWVDDRAFLMHHGDALRARSYVEPAGFFAVKFHAPGKRRDGSRDQPKQRRFPARVGAQDGHDFAFAGLKAGGAQRKRGNGLRGDLIRIACLLNIEAHILIAAGALLAPCGYLQKSFMRAHRSPRRSR